MAKTAVCNLDAAVNWRMEGRPM